MNLKINNQWCVLCNCFVSNHAIHVRGKRHNRKIERYESLFRHLPDSMKFIVTSFLYPNVCDHRSLYKQIHYSRMKDCVYQIARNNPSNIQCQRCYLPMDCLCYDDFLYLISNHFVCLNCVYNITTTTTYLSDLCLVVYGDCVQLCSRETYDTVHPFYRFDRIRIMMLELKQIQNRNSIQYSCFDVSLLYSFWTTNDFLTYIYQQFYNYTYVTQMFIASL